MTSTAANNNSVSSSQPAQSSFNGTKSGATSILASLANATEPKAFSFNQQQTSVATFPQRPTGGTPTANTGSSFGFSFSQASTSGSNPPFQFTNSSMTDASAPSFPDQSSANIPRFSFTNPQPGNSQNFTFNQPTANSQVQQPLGPFTFASSTLKEEIPNDKSQSSLSVTSTNSPKQTSATDASAPSFPNQSSANIPRFSFTNLQPGNPQNFTFNQPTANSQVQQRLGSFTFASSTLKEEIPNDKSQPSLPVTSTSNPKQTSATDASAPSFPNQSSANIPRFSFTNPQPGNPPNFTFNQPTANSQVRQPLGSFTFTSSTLKEEIPNDKSQPSLPLTSTNSPKQTSATYEPSRFTPNTVFKKLSDPPTPISEQSSSFNQEQEESDTPASLAHDSLLLKKINTTLHDPNALVVDRSDPNSPLYSLATFEQLNLKPDLLKG